MSLEHVTKIEIRRNTAGRWFWHAVAANGQVIETSGQAFYSKADAIRAAERTKAKIAMAPIVADRAQSDQLQRVLRALVDGRARRPSRSA